MEKIAVSRFITKEFQSAEALKPLRTNLMFSFSDEGRGHVIGITSAVQDEGKSSSACNTAYALSEAGKKVLLLEGDRVLAVTMGSKMANDTFDIHFEKAREDVDGAYTAINQQMAFHLREKHPELRFLDREVKR